ncbi:MAG: SPFH domain-containing protein, partial [Pseudomonadota bacterium]
MRSLPIIAAVTLGLTVVIALSSLFRVDERQQAIVLQFGQVTKVASEPGLYVKIPFIEEVAFYDGRILPLETSQLEVIPRNARRLVVDAFARWRISDVVKFRQSAQTEFAALERLDGILNASLRKVLGQVDSNTILSPERTILMQRIRDDARNGAQTLGIEIVDVRIRRADL